MRARVRLAATIAMDKLNRHTTEKTIRVSLCLRDEHNCEILCAECAQPRR